MRNYLLFSVLLILFAGCGSREGRNNNNCDLQPVDTISSLKIDSLPQAKPMVNVEPTSPCYPTIHWQPERFFRRFLPILLIYSRIHYFQLAA